MTDSEKMQSLISEISVLVDRGVKPTTPAFQAWFSDAERFIIRKYGQDSFEYRKLKETKFWSSSYFSEDAINVKKCKEGLVATKMIFQSYLDEMNEGNKDMANSAERLKFHNKVFIVHGHNGELRESVARIVEKQGIEAIILAEKATPGKTIIEKFEMYSDVGGAICLFTADDMAREKDATGEAPRARQNVVFETGFFMGKLGREHVVILADSEVEMPSDLSGVVYTNTTNWESDLLQNLKAMGYAVDFNKLF